MLLAFDERTSELEDLSARDAGGWLAVRKIPECDRCRFNLHNPYLVCDDYPAGPEGNSCLHFAPDPGATPEELWEPEGASYYNGELILQPCQRWTRKEQLELIDTHPLFTGKCPRCGHLFPRDSPPEVHWDCPDCNWVDDTA
jgi:hypothetical protein